MHLFNIGNGLIASRNSVRGTVRWDCPESSRPKMMFQDQGGKNSAKAGVKKPPKTASEPSFFGCFFTSIHT